MLAELLGMITGGAVEVIDLTAPLSSETPVLQLPPPFANTIHLSLEEVSNFDDAGPMWRWNNIHTGEHTGTHLDAPVHWATGRAGLSVDAIPLTRLIGPAVVVDVTAEVADDPDFLLEPDHLLAWERENGPIPDGALAAAALRLELTGRATRRRFSTPTRTARTRRARPSMRPAGWRTNVASPGSAWRRWVSTPAAPAA